ncbi:hypothetical protein C8T65DRAFT_730276 [Cerioporus squamosus]|nr:hypothetical protein C8T65DRAFT_730276 [Cerioporus squamosus]
MTYPYDPLLSPDPFARPSTRRPTTPPNTLPTTPIAPSEWLLFDDTWRPDDLEGCITFPRTYALAQPDRYPITHGLHQQLMRLAVRGVKAGEEGVDFAQVSSTVSPEELGMIASNPAAWDRWQRLYERREFCMDPKSYAQVAYALTGPFREQYKAAVSRRSRPDRNRSGIQKLKLGSYRSRMREYCRQWRN